MNADLSLNLLENLAVKQKKELRAVERYMGLSSKSTSVFHTYCRTA